MIVVKSVPSKILTFSSSITSYNPHFLSVGIKSLIAGLSPTIILLVYGLIKLKTA